MPFSSPTTTRAVNEKRRPPLTTLATRLISTTRSWRSRPAGETERSGAGIESLRLEDQAALAGAFGEGLHAAVVLVSAAVEDRRLDPRGLRPLGERLARAVVDELGEHAAVGAEHGDPGPLGGPGDLRAHAAAALEALGGACG